MNAQYPPIYVVSLERSKERRAHMAFQLERLNLPFQFLDATEGAALKPLEKNSIQQARDKVQFRKPFSNGELGCAHSHMRLYEKIAQEQNPSGASPSGASPSKLNLPNCALILEDDIFITEKLVSFLSPEVIAHLPQHWDIILLAFVQRGNTESRSGKRAIMKFAGRVRLPHGFVIGHPAQFCFHTAGYLVSVQGAQKLVQCGKPLRMPADFLTGNAHAYGLNQYVIRTPIIRQHHQIALQSTIKIDAQDSQLAHNLRSQKFSLSLLPKKIYYFVRRLYSIVLNKTLLTIRGHGFIVVFLRQLGILKPDKNGE